MAHLAVYICASVTLTFDLFTPKLGRVTRNFMLKMCLFYIHLYSSNNMIAKQIKKKKKNSKRAATTLHNKVYHTITRHL